MKKNNKYEVLGVDLSELSEEQFKDFASSHFAYDDLGAMSFKLQPLKGLSNYLWKTILVGPQKLYQISEKATKNSNVV